MAREEVEVGGLKAELKLDIRNITGAKYEEYQSRGDNRIYYNRYKIGTSFTLSASVRY